MLFDLELHLRRYEDLDAVFDLLSQAADAVAITGRGSNWRRTFELDYPTLMAALGRLRRWEVVRADGLLTEVVESQAQKRLLLLKAQEVFTAEGFDVIVVGSPAGFSDFTELSRIRESTLGGPAFTILGHPLLVPNVPLPRLLSSRARLLEILEQVDFVDGFSSSVRRLPRSLQERLIRMSAAADRPVVAVSDRHLYCSTLPRRLERFGLVLEGLDVRLPSAELLLQLKHLLQRRRFAVEACRVSPQLLRNVLGLRPGELLYLFRLFPDSLLSLFGFRRTTSIVESLFWPLEPRPGQRFSRFF